MEMHNGSDYNHLKAIEPDEITSISNVEYALQQKGQSLLSDLPLTKNPKIK